MCRKFSFSFQNIIFAVHLFALIESYREIRSVSDPILAQKLLGGSLERSQCSGSTETRQIRCTETETNLRGHGHISIVHLTRS